MGCCVCNYVEMNKLEFAIQGQKGFRDNPDFFDLSLSSENDIPIKDLIASNQTEFKTNVDLSLSKIKELYAKKYISYVAAKDSSGKDPLSPIKELHQKIDSVNLKLKHDNNVEYTLDVDWFSGPGISRLVGVEIPKESYLYTEYFLTQKRNLG